MQVAQDTVPQGPKCFGGDPRLVGREAAFSFGDGESRRVEKRGERRGDGDGVEIMSEEL